LGRSPIWQHRSAPAAHRQFRCPQLCHSEGRPWPPSASGETRYEVQAAAPRAAGWSAMPSQLGTTGWRRINATPRQRAQSTKCGATKSSGHQRQKSAARTACRC